MRHKGFAYMESGMPGLIDQHDPPAALGEETRCCCAGRATTDYGDIVFIVTSDFGPHAFRYLRDTTHPTVVFVFIYCRIVGAANMLRQANVMVDSIKKPGKIKPC
jgi:hypothetical protein